MKKSTLWTSAIASLCALCVTAHADPQNNGAALHGNQSTAKVICGTHSLQQAVDRAAEGATISVRGTCTEEVVIRKDRIRIVGEDGATIQAPGIVLAILSDGVEIRNLNIIGGTVGIDIFGGASAEIANNYIHNYSQAGIEVRANSNAIIRDNYISSTNGPLVTGVNVIASASAQLERNTIENANGNGVNIASASAAFLACDNTVTVSHPAFAGVFVSRTAQLGFGPGPECANSISNEAGRALFCSQTSSVFFGAIQNLTGAVQIQPNCEVLSIVGPPFP